MRCMTHGATRQRMALRIRHPRGSRRDGGKVPWVCSEPSTRPEGRRKSFAGHARNATARQIVVGYRLRWAGELFHTAVKPHLGFEDGATRGCASVLSHVPWG